MAASFTELEFRDLVLGSTSFAAQLFPSRISFLSVVNRLFFRAAVKLIT